MKEIINTSLNKSVNAFELGNKLMFNNFRMLEFTEDLSLNVAKLAPVNKTISISLISGSGKYYGVGSYDLEKGHELTISTNFGDFEFKTGTILVILY